MKKMLFMINPKAGRGMAGGQLLRIIDEFTRAGYEVTVRTTQSADDLYDTFLARGCEFDILVCSGGDGTLNAAVSALSRYEGEGEPTLAYIPSGTVNDFARSRKISKNPLTAARAIVSGKPQYIDIGRLGDKVFTYVAAFGVFTSVSYETPQEMKNNLGRTAYLIEGMKSLISSAPIRMRFEYGGNVIEDSFIFGMMANSEIVGGFDLPINRGSKFDDGLMEVTLAKYPRTPAEQQKLLNCLLTQKADSEFMYHFQCGRLKFTAAAPIPWTVDGEFGGSMKSGELHVCRNAIKLVY